MKVDNWDRQLANKGARTAKKQKKKYDNAGSEIQIKPK